MGHIIRVALQPQDRQPRPMPNIDYITVKGFKSIASIENLNLRPLNILIGPNGSGKSNFLEVFSLLKAIRYGGLQAYVARESGAVRSSTNSPLLRTSTTPRRPTHPSGSVHLFRGIKSP